MLSAGLVGSSRPAASQISAVLIGPFCSGALQISAAAVVFNYQSSGGGEKEDGLVCKMFSVFCALLH